MRLVFYRDVFHGSCTRGLAAAALKCVTIAARSAPVGTEFGDLIFLTILCWRQLLFTAYRSPDHGLPILIVAATCVIRTLTSRNPRFTSSDQLWN